jgi:hypothetical protein
VDVEIQRCPNDGCPGHGFQERVETTQTGILSRDSNGNIEFVGDCLGSLEPAKFDHEGREVVQCRSCHDHFAIADDELVPLPAKDRETVEVPKDALESTLEFLVDDPALDTVPMKSDLIGAIQQLEQCCEPENPRYVEADQR